MTTTAMTYQTLCISVDKFRRGSCSASWDVVIATHSCPWRSGFKSKLVGTRNKRKAMASVKLRRDQSIVIDIRLDGVQNAQLAWCRKKRQCRLLSSRTAVYFFFLSLTTQTISPIQAEKMATKFSRWHLHSKCEYLKELRPDSCIADKMQPWS